VDLRHCAELRHENKKLMSIRPDAQSELTKCAECNAQLVSNVQTNTELVKQVEHLKAQNVTIQKKPECCGALIADLSDES
jgi:uncharacterized protein with PIN domain